MTTRKCYCGNKFDSSIKSIRCDRCNGIEPKKQEMIDRIYEVIADKTLSFGCKLSSPKWIFVERMDSKKETFTYYDIWLDNIRLGNNSRYRHRRSNIKLWKEIRVIWHDVMIWDIFERIRWDKRDELYSHWNVSHRT